MPQAIIADSRAKRDSSDPWRPLLQPLLSRSSWGARFLILERIKIGNQLDDYRDAMIRHWRWDGRNNSGGVFDSRPPSFLLV